MEKLIRERKSLEPRLNRVLEIVAKLEPEAAEAIDVITELEMLGDIWAAYSSVHKRILDISESDAMYQDAVQQQCRFESTYIGLKNRLSKTLKLVQNRESRQEERSLSQSDIIQQLAEQQAALLRVMSDRMSAGASASSAALDIAPAPMPLTDLKLPRMSLPVFSGDYLEWQSFIDLFQSWSIKMPHSGIARNCTF